MNHFEESSIFIVPLTSKQRQQAKQFSSQQSHRQKIQQVYLNTLAVCAVKFYLDCMGIETEIAASDSWNPVMQSLSNVADLKIKNLGSLECCTVLSNAQFCYISPEASDRRIGYIFVQFDSLCKNAVLLGFVKTAARQSLHFSELNTLESLLKHLNQLQSPVSINLSKWLDSIFEIGWQPVEDFSLLQKTELAFNYRSRTSSIERGKIIHLGQQSNQIILLIEIESITELELGISTKIYPSNSKEWLPKDLTIEIIDQDGVTMMQTQDRSRDNWMRLKFTVEKGESFSIAMTSNNYTKIERILA